MPDYKPNVLLRIKKPIPIRKQHSPHAWDRPQYGNTQKFTTLDDSSDKLPSLGILRVQQIIGSLLYYALVVDCNLLVALGDLLSAHTTAIENTWDAIVWLLSYAATHPNASITYHASDMCLHVHIDAS